VPGAVAVDMCAATHLFAVCRRSGAGLGDASRRRQLVSLGEWGHVGGVRAPRDDTSLGRHTRRAATKGRQVRTGGPTPS